jgi:hypothetical protein
LSRIIVLLKERSNDSFETAEKTICGIELMHMISKGQVEEIECVLTEVEFINKIMGVVA